MGIFSRKKKNTEEENPKLEFKFKHEHVFKDMPWYMEVQYDGAEKTASYQIIESYICITCGERQNKVLEKESWQGITVDAREKEYEAIRKRYHKYLRPRAVVEDMINNILLVKDPGRLEMLEKMRGTPHSGCGTSSKMKNDPHYKIEVPKDAT